MLSRPFLVFMFLSFLACPLTTTAQPPSRAQHWRQKRLQKAQNLKPYRVKKMERVFLTVESSQIPARIAMGFWGFHPMFSGLKTGAGTGGGIIYDPTRNLKHFRLALKVGFSVRGYQAYQAVMGFQQKKWSVYGFGQYRNSPQDNFFGVGANSLKQNKSNFRLKDGFVGGVLGFKPHTYLSTLLQFTYLSNRIGPGTSSEHPSIEKIFSDTDTPGINDDVDYLVGKVGITFDSRNVYYAEDATLKSALAEDILRQRVFNPHKGTYVNIQASRFEDQVAGQFDFNRLDLEVQQYLPFYRGHQVIALRFFTTLIDRDEKSTAPFYMIQTIGGANSLRGYQEFRFRDLNNLLFNIEYRWLVWTGLDMALFFDAGKVFPRVNEFDFDDLKKGYGFGFRFNTMRSVILRLDISRSTEGTVLYFKFNNVF